MWEYIISYRALDQSGEIFEGWFASKHDGLDAASLKADLERMKESTIFVKIWPTFIWRSDADMGGVVSGWVRATSGKEGEQ